MRPLRLQLEGFTAFRDPVDLNLEELDLFAITGPTGAGKSSLIDAVSYALYGRVPRVATEVASCISLGMDRMQVDLEFRAGEERYRVHRETRRRGQGAVRLERCRDGDWLPLADRVKEVNDKVEEVVGLDYDGFTRSVILPQGQFQEFLAGSAEKRRSVLRSLLRLEVYDRMRVRASGIASEVKTRIDERQRTLDSLAEATPENVARLAADLETIKDEAEALASQLKLFDTALPLAITLNHARDAVTRCESEAAGALDAYGKSTRLVAEGDAALSQLDHELEELDALLQSNAYDAGRHAALGVALERVKALAETRAGIDQATRQLGDATKQAANAGAAVEKASAAHTAAEAALVAAETARTEAQRHNLAASLQRGLKPGDPCPVCGGKIGALSPLDATGLEAAEKKLAVARKAESEARTSLMTASNAAARATSTAEGAQARLDELQARVSAQERDAAEALLAGQDASLEAVSLALAAQVEARGERQAIEERRGATSTKRQAEGTQVEQARANLAALEQRNLAAARSLESAYAVLETARRDVEAVAGDQWPDVAVALSDGRDVAILLRLRQEETGAERSRLQNLAGQTEARLERLKQDSERAAQLREGLDGLRKELDVSTDLARMLRADKFQTFLQYEALRTLAQDGSKRLEELSNGRYRLQVDDRGAEFEVVDLWNADRTRSVKTLSGGETFLASLALSLALAESLPGLAASGRVVLESIFLDEGFGSLDAEALDRAADALDALRAEDRMVCIVTHLQDLAQRLPARIVVTRTESGSSVAIA